MKISALNITHYTVVTDTATSLLLSVAAVVAAVEPPVGLTDQIHFPGQSCRIAFGYLSFTGS